MTRIVAVLSLFLAVSTASAQVVVGSYTKSGMEAISSPSAGTLVRVTDDARGLWMYQGAQWFSLSGSIVNVRDFGATGDGTTDDGLAIANAITAGAGKIVYFPPGVYRVHHRKLTVKNGGTTLLGAGPQSTYLKYEPDAHGALLKFEGRDQYDNPVQITNVRVHGFTFQSADTTYAKAMIEFDDVRGGVIERVTSADSQWHGSSSIGLHIRGREQIVVRDSHIYADIPIQIDTDPTYEPYSLDTSGVYIPIQIDTDPTYEPYSLDTSGVYNTITVASGTNPNVKIVDGAILQNVSFEDDVFVLGGHGIYWNTTSITPSRFLRVTNSRFEQSTNSSGYSLYLASSASGMQQFFVDGFYSDGAGHKGFYLRACEQCTLKNVAHYGSSESLNVDSTDRDLVLLNPTFVSAATGTPAHDRARVALETPNAEPLWVARDATYTSDAGAAAAVVNATTPGKMMSLGYDSSADFGYIQTLHAATNLKPLALNPRGGGVTVGNGTAVQKILSASAALDFGSTAAQSSADLTITVTGSAAGDPCFVGAPNGAVTANSSFSCWVSASNTVTVRFNNYGATSANPASGTFRVVVQQF